MGTPSIVNRFRLFYLLLYGGIGIFLTYLALYFKSVGLSGGQVGTLLAVVPLTGFLVQPLWGLLSDLFHMRKWVLASTSLGVALVTPLLGVTTNFHFLLAIMILYAALHGSANPLGIALTLDYLDDGGGKEAFGSLRLWGSLGFAVSSFIVGALLITDAPARIIPVYSITMFLLAIVVLSLPDAEPQETSTPDLREGIRLLTRDRILGLFLLGTLLIGMTLGIVNNYLTVYLDDIHAPGWIIGAALAISALAEMPLMANVPRFLDRWGLRLVLVGGVAVLPVRWLLYAFIEEPLLVLPTQVLHSIAVMALMVVGVLYIDRQLTRRWRASGQALYGAALYGFGPSLGVFAAGQIYEYAGIRPVWMISTVVALIGTLILNTAVRARAGATATSLPEATS